MQCTEFVHSRNNSTLDYFILQDNQIKKKIVGHFGNKMSNIENLIRGDIYINIFSYPAIGPPENWLQSKVGKTVQYKFCTLHNLKEKC